MTDFTIARRALLALPGGLAGAWPSIVAAQRAEQVRRLHVMLGFAASDADARSRVSTLQQELGSLGWNEGLNIQIEYRWAGAVAERIQSLAMEPVGTIPDVIVAHSTPIAEALRREARTIPMVFLLVSDPIGSGLTTNLTTPDRNATGFTSFSPSV